MRKERKQYKCKVYNKVDNASRLKLIKLVENKTKLKDASIILGINYSTVKTIMKLYRSENRIYRKKKGGNLRIKSKKCINDKLLQKEKKQANVFIEAFEAKEKNKKEKISEKPFLSEPILSHNVGYSLSEETRKIRSVSIEDAKLTFQKNTSDFLLEEFNKIKLRHEKEFQMYEMDFYLSEKSKLNQEINKNNFFIFYLLALQELWKICSAMK